MARMRRRTSVNLRKRQPESGTVASPGLAPLAAEQPIVLRLPKPLLCRVDEVVQARPIRIPRHTWLLEAVLEKLEREQT